MQGLKPLGDKGRAFAARDPEGTPPCPVTRPYAFVPPATVPEPALIFISPGISRAKPLGQRLCGTAGGYMGGVPSKKGLVQKRSMPPAARRVDRAIGAALGFLHY